MIKKREYYIYALLALPYILVCLSLILYKSFVPALALSYSEANLVNYVSEVKDLSELLHAPPSMSDILSSQKAKNPFKLKALATPPQDYRIQAKEPIRLKVNLIIIGLKRKYTIINGHLLKEGDVIEGYRVQEIRRDRVIISRGSTDNINILKMDD